LQWFFDYTTFTVYVMADPTDAAVELSVSAHAFRSTAQNVTLDGRSVLVRPVNHLQANA
jgi:hypothetical protein